MTKNTQELYLQRDIFQLKAEMIAFKTKTLMGTIQIKEVKLAYS